MSLISIFPFIRLSDEELQYPSVFYSLFDTGPQENLKIMILVRLLFSLHAALFADASFMQASGPHSLDMSAGDKLLEAPASATGDESKATPVALVLPESPEKVVAVEAAEQEAAQSQRQLLAAREILAATYDRSGRRLAAREILAATYDRSGRRLAAREILAATYPPAVRPPRRMRRSHVGRLEGSKTAGAFVATTLKRE